jgi:CDP-diglyceride synthetase
MKTSTNLQNDMNLQDSFVGTRFGKTGIVRLKLTHKDFLLLAGIVVAVIIALTTMIVESNLTQGEVHLQLPSLINSAPSPTVIIQKLYT